MASDHGDLKYWAFISYSHADAKWAEWLHRQLETFPVPRALVGRETERGHRVPKRLFPVFRDREELPGSSSLAENINAALRSSRYLIVICSPRSAVSRWVNQEVMAFKAMGRADRVLCLVVDGEPNATDKPESGLLECFPPGVRFGVDPEGCLSAEREEPIAADARSGKDGRRDALIKLASGLLGVGFDELKQRNMARQRRMRALWSAAVAALLMVSGLAAHRIWEEQQRANRGVAIALALNDFLINDLLKQAGSEAQADARQEVNPNLTVREALERAAARIGDRFKSEPLIEATIRRTIGEAWRQIGYFGPSVDQMEKAWRLREAEQGAQHPDTLTAMEDLAISCSEVGRREEALELEKNVLRLRREKLGAEHPATLTSMHNLALVYFEIGKASEAIELQREVLRLRRKVLGDVHPRTADAMGNLASTLANFAQAKEAMDLREQVLKTQRDLLGREHPAVIVPMLNLATSYSGLARSQEAFDLRQEALVLSRKILGPHHSNTLYAMSEVAASLVGFKRFNEAIEMLKEANKTFMEKLGDSPPATLHAVDMLGSAYSESGKEVEAMALRENLLKAYISVYGKNNPHTFEAMRKLAISYANSSRVDDALKLQQEEVDLRRAKYGQKFWASWDTHDSINNLAVYYERVGRFEEVIKLRQEILDWAQEKHREDYSVILEAMWGLAKALADAGQSVAAFKVHEEMLKKCREKPLETLQVVQTISYAWLELGRGKEALELRKEILKNSRTALGPEHPRTLLAMQLLGLFHKEVGEFEPALTVFHELLPLCEKALGPEHVETFSSVNNLAMTLSAAGRLPEAVQLLRQRAAASSTARAAVRYNLACYECLSGNLEEARRLIAEEVAAKPDNKAQALKDDDLAALRDFIESL